MVLLYTTFTSVLVEDPFTLRSICIVSWSKAAMLDLNCQQMMMLSGQLGSEHVSLGT